MITTGKEGKTCQGARAVTGQDVLAVVPTLNEARHIEACLRSLMEGSDPRLKDISFIVADGGSSDETCAIVAALMGEFDNLQLIHNPKKLQSAAINLAVAKHAEPHHAHLVRCDAHALYPPNYVLKVADALVQHQAQSVVTPMDAIGVTCFQKANAWVVDTPLGSGGAAHRGGRLSGFVDHGHHAGFDLAAFRKIGGYDETFSHNEDAEYDWRLTQSGGRIFLDADIRLQYSPRETPRGLARQYFNYGKGRARTLQKHRMTPKLRQIIPLLNLIALIGALGLALISPLMLLYPLFYLSVLGAASIALSVKHRSVCALASGFASAIMHSAWASGFLSGIGRQILGGHRT